MIHTPVSAGELIDKLSILHVKQTKITNEEVIDGAMRFMIDETQGEIRLYPISIYCIKEEDKYIFY